MARLSKAMVCAALLGVPCGLQAEAAPDTPPPHEVVATFHDGTVIHKAALHGNLELVTKYGKLSVPIRDVQRIEIGFRISAEDTRKVEEAIHGLGSKPFRQREAAGRKLVELGFRAFPAVQKATASKDAEVARRAQAVLQKIQQTTPADKLQLKPHDTVVTAECVLTGRLVSDTLRAKTPAFGEMQFRLLDLRTVHSATNPPPQGTTVSGYSGVAPVAAPAAAGLPVPAPLPAPPPAFTN